MLTNRALSNKIKLLSFVATIFVVMIHSSSAAATGGVSTWNIWLHDFLTKRIVGVAVPFFFMISGFWFGRGYCATAEYDRGYVGFLLKKLKTLAVPYLLFSILGLPFILGYYGLWNYLHNVPLLE